MKKEELAHSDGCLFENDQDVEFNKTFEEYREGYVNT